MIASLLTWDGYIAYYAHWAAKRGKYLMSGGANASDLAEMSNKWMKESIPSLYFV